MNPEQARAALATAANHERQTTTEISRPQWPLAATVALPFFAFFAFQDIDPLRWRLVGMGGALAVILAIAALAMFPRLAGMTRIRVLSWRGTPAIWKAAIAAGVLTIVTMEIADRLAGHTSVPLPYTILSAVNTVGVLLAVYLFTRTPKR